MQIQVMFVSADITVYFMPYHVSSRFGLMRSHAAVIREQAVV